MKKVTSILCLFLFLATTVLGQRDTSFRIKIEINPLEDLAVVLVGEIGATIQIPIRDSTEKSPFVAFMLGGGYNIGPNNAKGYTIRAGVYRFLGKNSFILFEAFYRDWFSISNVNDGDNPIIDPTTQISGSPDRNGFSVEVDNAKVRVYSADFSFGKQYLLKKSNGSSHFIIEWLVGLGLRTKSIEIEELGTLHNGQFDPKGNPSYAASYPSTYPYLKLGVMLGYKL